jgi:hypothetical protein
MTDFPVEQAVRGSYPGPAHSRATAGHTPIVSGARTGAEIVDAASLDGSAASDFGPIDRVALSANLRSAARPRIEGSFGPGER